MSKAGSRAAQTVESEYFAAVAQFLSAYGLSEPAARVLALMYLAHAPQMDIGAADMAQILGVSRATIGNALTELEAGGLVVRSTAPGSKRAHYRTFRDSWDFYHAVLQQRRVRAVDQSLRLLRQALAQKSPAKTQEGPLADRTKALMNTAGRMRRWMDALTDLTREELQRFFGMTPEQIRRCLDSE